MKLDLGAAYELGPLVALRPESFGALAYHYGNRRLTFIRSTQLVEMLHELNSHTTLHEAICAHCAGVDPHLLDRTLESLVTSDLIRRV